MGFLKNKGRIQAREIDQIVRQIKIKSKFKLKNEIRVLVEANHLKIEIIIIIHKI